MSIKVIPPLLLIAALLSAPAAQAQERDVPTSSQDSELIAIARGTSELMGLSNQLARVAIADSSIANVVVLSPREIIVNGVTVGTTSMIVWEADGTVQNYTIEVSVDVDPINRIYEAVFPGEELRATAHGNVVVLSGTVSGWEVAQRMVEIAQGTGATVISNFACIRPSVDC